MVSCTRRIGESLQLLLIIFQADTPLNKGGDLGLGLFFEAMALISNQSLTPTRLDPNAPFTPSNYPDRRSVIAAFKRSVSHDKGWEELETSVQLYGFCWPTGSDDPHGSGRAHCPLCGTERVPLVRTTAYTQAQSKCFKIFITLANELCYITQYKS